LRADESVTGNGRQQPPPSSSTAALKSARRIFYHPGDGLTPTFKRVSGDAIEVRYVAKDEEDLAMFWFYLMAALGHAVYL
jgi:hypothetical protein